MEGIETLSLRLDENETMALAQFVKRLSWSDLRGCAVSDEEALSLIHISEPTRP